MSECMGKFCNLSNWYMSQSMRINLVERKEQKEGLNDMISTRNQFHGIIKVIQLLPCYLVLPEYLHGNGCGRCQCRATLSSSFHVSLLILIIKFVVHWLNYFLIFPPSPAYILGYLLFGEEISTCIWNKGYICLVKWW